MNITEITSRAGADKRRKRLGRGESSGSGKTCGRGSKGAGSRSGWKQRGFQEGGQMPTFRRIPKRGFSNVQYAQRYEVVNLAEIDAKFEAGAHVTPEALHEAGLIRTLRLPVKILGNGTITKKMKIEASKFSASALEKIKSAGGEPRELQTA
jgi:large subunit ribosomal protein L15